jgi:hypothetical protein
MQCPCLINLTCSHVLWFYLKLKLQNRKSCEFTNDIIAQEHGRDNCKSKSSKHIGKETKWSDRGPTARNDEGNESTKQHLDTGEIKQRIIESKKKMQTCLLKGINFVGAHV